MKYRFNYIKFKIYNIRLLNTINYLYFVIYNSKI